MIIISGKKYGSDVTIVNKRIVTGKHCDTSFCRKFNKIEKQLTDGVNRITINSNVNLNVKLFACDTNEMSAHLHGSAIIDSSLELSVTRHSDEIRVSAETDCILNSYNNMPINSQCTVAINSLGSNESLVLDVQIPIRVFKKISVESTCANINVDSSVIANSITVENKNGNISVSAIFQDLTIECKNGNVDIGSEACCNVNLNVISKNGNIDVTIENIGTSYISLKSENGRCKNNPKLRGVYTVSGYIISQNGNVKFH